MNGTMDLREISEVIEKIPVDEVLKIAEYIKERMKNDSDLIEIKEKKQFVTKADKDIQAFILEYLENSRLKGTYKIKAEEDLAKKYIQGNSWKLLVDPLDGTSAFCNGKNEWGVMIGACDIDGILRYSWNLVSSGDVYSSGINQFSEILESFSSKIDKEEKIAIDVYDYGAGASERFGAVFEKLSGLNNSHYIQTSYPAAVWTGWKLFTQELNGLLWLPSNEGKKFYPDYDLIFLGALKARGYNIRLGKIGTENIMIAIAPLKEDIEILWKTGLELIPEKQREEIQVSQNPLQINTKLEVVK